VSAVQREHYRQAALTRWQDQDYRKNQSAMRRRCWKRRSYRRSQQVVNAPAIKRWQKHDPERFAALQQTLAQRPHPGQSRAMRRRWRNPMIRKMYLGVIGNNNRPEWLDRKGRLWRFRSTWELGFAQWLDRQKLAWSYEPCALLLSDGRTYIPDFWVPRWRTYVELKAGHYSAVKAHLAVADGHAVLLLQGRAVQEFYAWVTA